MKKIFLLFVTIVLILSCSSDNSSLEEETTELEGSYVSAMVNGEEFTAINFQNSSLAYAVIYESESFTSISIDGIIYTSNLNNAETIYLTITTEELFSTINAGYEWKQNEDDKNGFSGRYVFTISTNLEINSVTDFIKNKNVYFKITSIDKEKYLISGEFSFTSFDKDKKYTVTEGVFKDLSYKDD